MIPGSMGNPASKMQGRGRTGDIAQWVKAPVAKPGRFRLILAAHVIQWERKCLIRWRVPEEDQKFISECTYMHIHKRMNAHTCKTKYNLFVCVYVCARTRACVLPVYHCRPEEGIRSLWYYNYRGLRTTAWML